MKLSGLYFAIVHADVLHVAAITELDGYTPVGAFNGASFHGYIPDIVNGFRSKLDGRRSADEGAVGNVNIFAGTIFGKFFCSFYDNTVVS